MFYPLLIHHPSMKHKSMHTQQMLSGWKNGWVVKTVCDTNNLNRFQCNANESVNHWLTLSRLQWWQKKKTMKTSDAEQNPFPAIYPCPLNLHMLSVYLEKRKSDDDDLIWISELTYEVNGFSEPGADVFLVIVLHWDALILVSSFKMVGTIRRYI